MNDFGDFADHGGALDTARRLFPDAPQPWVDLSTGINPVPYPFAAVSSQVHWTRLPDASALAHLERTAALRYGATQSCAVVAAPGTQAIIQQLPTLAAGHDVRMIGPTYGEYERVFRDGGARVRIVHDLESLGGADVAVVVNPNNPDGRLVAPNDLRGLAGRVGTLVVDEAFVDALAPAQSLVPLLPPTRVIVLRSFGKIYGLAGLRLGFALGPAETCALLRRRLGPWAVGGPAIAIGTEALADERWLAATQARLRVDGARLACLLGQAGATTIGGTPLFRLVSHPAAPGLFRDLAERGILTRPFKAERSWLRFGLPGNDVEWRRLETALSAFG